MRQRYYSSQYGRGVCGVVEVVVSEERCCIGGARVVRAALLTARVAARAIESPVCDSHK